MPSKSLSLQFFQDLTFLRSKPGASRIKHQVYGSYLVLLIAFEIIPAFQGVTQLFID
jgi:hypothetical protein